MCFCNVKALCLIPYILLFSKPQPQTATTGSSTVLSPWSNLSPMPTSSWTSTTPLYASCRQAVRILLLQRSCKLCIHHQFCHTALYEEIYSGSRSCCTLYLRVFQIVLLSRIQTSVPGKYGSKVFQLALHDRS